MSLDRARAFRRLAQRALREGSASLSDAELLLLLELQRWAMARVSDARTPASERSVLNAAAFDAHAVLHRRRAQPISLGQSLRRVGGAVGFCLGIFLAAGAASYLLVSRQPTLGYALVPREILSQISPTHWGARGSLSEGVGMTFFYWGNNLRAAFLSLSLGAVLGVFALVPLSFNAAMLGAVVAVSSQRGALGALLGWIAPHGVPELGSLILCSAIGLQLGRGWLFPGARPRSRSAAEAGRVLSPVMVLAALMVICAAPLEGFVAPLSLPPLVDAGLALAWAVLLSTLVAVALRRDAAARRSP